MGELKARLEGQGHQTSQRHDGRPPAKRLLTRLIVLIGLSLACSPLAQSRQSEAAPAAQDPGPARASVNRMSASQPALTLRVYNYAHLNSGLLGSARVVVTGIFSRAGVEADWIECPLSQADFEKYPDCQRQARTADFVVRLMPASMAAKLPTTDGPLGFAQLCPDHEQDCVANIFYPRIDELASRAGGTTPRLLGHAIAHEVGHLLLGPNAHSPTGIMRGLWSPDDLRFMKWSYLAFGPEQSRQLRASLARRHAAEASVASNASGHL